MNTLSFHELKYRSIVNEVNEGIVQIDLNGRIQGVNKAFEEMFGYMNSEIYNQPVELLIPNQFRSKHEAYLADYHRTGKANIVGMSGRILMVRRKNGEEFPVQICVVEVRDNHEFAFIAIIDDMTELQRSERTAKQLAYIMNHSLNEIFIFTPDDFKVVYANEGACQNIGYELDELLHLNANDILPLLSNSNLREKLEPLLNRSQQKVMFETEHLRKDGSRYDAAITIQYIIYQECFAFLLVAHDVTEHKQMELALEEARDKADKASEAKSKFLSGMTHELRTPLNAVLGFSEILLFDGENLSPQQREGIEAINRSAHHLLSLVNQVLDLSTIESGKINYRIEDVQIADVLRQSLEWLDHQINLRKLQLINNIQSGSWPTVRADAVCLVQVFNNLISNAIKYNSTAGKVILDAEITKSDNIRVSITDTGIGIPSHRQHEMFEAFNRLGASFSDISGAGIGLFITRSLVESMGGTIGFFSEAGKGSTFWFELAIAESARNEKVDSIAANKYAK